jgi:hypothetical protein
MSAVKGVDLKVVSALFTVLYRLYMLLMTLLAALYQVCSAAQSNTEARGRLCCNAVLLTTTYHM